MNFFLSQPASIAERISSAIIDQGIGAAFGGVVAAVVAAVFALLLQRWIHSHYAAERKHLEAREDAERIRREAREQEEQKRREDEQMRQIKISLFDRRVGVRDAVMRALYADDPG